MKRYIMALAAAACLMLSGCSSGVSKEEYDSLSTEYSELEEKYRSLNEEYRKIESDYISALQELDDLRMKYQNPLDIIPDNSNETNIIDDNKNVAIYDDEYISIKYDGFGKGAAYPFEDRQCLILIIENKTDTVFDFQPQSLALDGIDVGKLVCYDSVSPHSKGKIFILKMSNTDIDFDNTSPSKITGTIAIQDSSDTGLFGSNYWYTISFIDVDL